MSLIDKNVTGETKKRIVLLALAILVLIAADLTLMTQCSPPTSYELQPAPPHEQDGGFDKINSLTADEHQVADDPHAAFTNALSGSSWVSTDGSKAFISPKGTVDETSTDGAKVSSVFRIGIFVSTSDGFKGTWTLGDGTEQAFEVTVGEAMEMESPALQSSQKYVLAGGGGGSKK